jgi:hypothetical protein
VVENITVTVKWYQQAGAVYHTRVRVRQQSTVGDRVSIPPIPSIYTDPGGTMASFQLTILYNSEYIVSVDSEIIVAPCRFNVTADIRLYYGENQIRIHVECLQ